MIKGSVALVPIPRGLSAFIPGLGNGEKVVQGVMVGGEVEGVAVRGLTNSHRATAGTGAGLAAAFRLVEWDTAAAKAAARAAAVAATAGSRDDCSMLGALAVHGGPDREADAGTGGKSMDSSRDSKEGGSGTSETSPKPLGGAA